MPNGKYGNLGDGKGPSLLGRRPGEGREETLEADCLWDTNILSYKVYM